MLGRLKSGEARLLMSSRIGMNPAGVMVDEHLELKRLECWGGRKLERTFQGRDKDLRGEDKIICLWFTTDLYLFEGDKHAQI